MEIIGKALKSKKRKAVPWWNNECGAAIKEKIMHLGKLNQHLLSLTENVKQKNNKSSKEKI